MQFNHIGKRDSGIVVRAMSAIVFLAFTFLWLFSFQADVLAYAQHVFSNGQTHYNSFVGALLITVVLWLLQLGVYAIVRLRNSFHALTYFPSMTLLALLGAVSANPSRSLGLWWLVPVLLFCLWLLVVWIAKQITQFEPKRRPAFFTRSMWVNMLILALMMSAVAATSNTNAVFHYRARMETCLLDHRLDAALRVGRKSLETDASLTMLRAYALSQQGKLAERLFEYPVAGRGADLVPVSGLTESQFLRYPQDRLYRHLGAIPRQGMDTPTYLSRIQQSGQATKAVADYVLCGLLVDRDIDGFARTISRYYQVSDSVTLPRHYREALTLYTHLRTRPVLVYHDAVTDEDYADLQELESQYRDPRERHIRVKEKYQGSYWYYYEYMK